MLVLADTDGLPPKPKEGWCCVLPCVLSKLNPAPPLVVEGLPKENPAAIVGLLLLLLLFD